MGIYDKICVPTYLQRKKTQPYLPTICNKKQEESVLKKKDFISVNTAIKNVFFFLDSNIILSSKTLCATNSAINEQKKCFKNST